MLKSCGLQRRSDSFEELRSVKVQGIDAEEAFRTARDAVKR
jgi:hypothetical protein